MPEIKHETLRSEKMVIGSYEVEFDDKGVATVPIEVYEAARELKGFTLLDRSGKEITPSSSLDSVESKKTVVRLKARSQNKL